MPTNVVGAVTPPTVTVTVCRGLGRFASGVVGEGVFPVPTLGVTFPSPVTKSGTVSPTFADRDGFTVPSANIKIPGPALDTVKLYSVYSYGFPSPSVATPFGVSYGICRFTWLGPT